MDNRDDMGVERPEMCILSIASDLVINHKLNVFDLKTYITNDYENIVDNDVGGMIFTFDSRSEEAEKRIWRFKFKTVIEVERFKTDFEEATGTKWYVFRNDGINNNEMKQYVLSLKFCCQYKGERRKTKEERKISHCQAKMEFRIKKDLICHSSDPLMPEYPCEFILNGTHHHETNSSGPCMALPSLEGATIEKLIKSFFNNDQPAIARHKIRRDLKLMDQNHERIQDTLHLPHLRQIYYLWDKWKSGKDWPSVLANIKHNYPSADCIRICEELYVVAIVTDLMKRVHKFNPLSKEIVFISTSNTGMYHICVTFIFTSSSIGAMPLGIILSDGQDEESYTKGFDLIKDLVEGYGFFGNEYPAIIITDDHHAERNALKNVWPSSILLLCIFNFLQAFWRWLSRTQNCVAKEDRKKLIRTFKNIVYCQNKDNLCRAKVSFQNLQSFKKNNLLKIHYNDMLQHIELWSKAYRTDYITLGKDNNFSEATMRVFKEIIIERCRLYNPAQFVEYIFKDYESYHAERIRDFLCTSRSVKVFRDGSKKLDIAKKFLPKNEVIATDISQSKSETYIVKSKNLPSVTYEVTPHNFMCSCLTGISGATCKHLLGVHLYTNAVLFTFPPASLEDLNRYHLIAFGQLPESNRYASHVNKNKKKSESIFAGVALAQQANTNIDAITDQQMEIHMEDFANTNSVDFVDTLNDRTVISKSQF
ncbi:unnamed protein product, partial [Meganyctiphanes norvegica]